MNLVQLPRCEQARYDSRICPRPATYGSPSYPGAPALCGEHAFPDYSRLLWRLPLAFAAMSVKSTDFGARMPFPVIVCYGCKTVGAGRRSIGGAGVFGPKGWLLHRDRNSPIARFACSTNCALSISGWKSVFEAYSGTRPE